MAIDTLEKLEKTKRDYPNQKFAVQFVDKALKKSPRNAYLLAWRADLAIKLNAATSAVTDMILATMTVPGLRDTLLLSHLYKLWLEAARRSRTSQEQPMTMNTAGQKFQQAWQSVTKAVKSKAEQEDLWLAFFNVALEEDCWEDVRFAILHVNKFVVRDKKQSHFALLLATQLAAEQKSAIGGEEQMSQLQYSVALQKMKQAYEAPPDDPIALKDIRDLRFMARIYIRQQRCEELCRLWDAPPKSLESLFHRHHDDLVDIMIRGLREVGPWKLLENHCVATVEETLSKVDLDNKDRPEAWELCARRWNIWEALLHAVTHCRSEEEGKAFVLSQIDATFRVGLKAKDRPSRLTYMTLRQFAGENMLVDCKEYFEHHAHLACCFDDLRLHLQKLSRKDSCAFMEFVSSHTKGSYQSAIDVSNGQYENWRQTELNRLKINYMWCISRSSPLERVPAEDMLNNSLALLNQWSDNEDLGSLVIYILLQLHRKHLCRDEERNSPETVANSRILLQATMLARHLVETDKSKSNRKFALLAARLHLNLGLGTIAFRLYGRAKCKEMLQETLSLYMLSRISQTHPFDVNAHGGFSADDELASVIGTIERMERKIDGFQLPPVNVDQLLDSMALKRKLNSSLTKHVCIVERRRIARLKGDSAVGLPIPDYKTYQDISSNVDTDIFPDYEDSQGDHVGALVMPNSIPTPSWLLTTHFVGERSRRLLFRETGYDSLDPFLDIYRKGAPQPSPTDHTPTEHTFKSYWTVIDNIVADIFEGETTGKLSVDVNGSTFDTLLNSIIAMRKAEEKLLLPITITTLRPEDEPTMFHENKFMASYGKFEICRAVIKLVDLLREKVLKGKTKHPLRARLPPNFDTRLRNEVEMAFNAVRDVAHSYINLLKTRGVAAIKAQVRWGVTGRYLERMLSDEDMEFYAGEYVESAMEAWKGVLKVKMDR